MKPRSDDYQTEMEEHKREIAGLKTLSLGDEMKHEIRGLNSTLVILQAAIEGGAVELESIHDEIVRAVYDAVETLDRIDITCDVLFERTTDREKEKEEAQAE